MSTYIRRDLSSYELSQYGNCPIEILMNQPITQAAPDGNTIFTLDLNPCVDLVDISAIDTPNYSRRTCNEFHIIEALRKQNKQDRLTADQFLQYRLGRVAATAYKLEGTVLEYSWACVLGIADIHQLDLPPRIRDRNANPRLRTKDDPDFSRRRRRYRNLRRNDVHSKLLDSSWVGPPSRHPSEIQHV